MSGETIFTDGATVGESLDCGFRTIRFQVPINEPLDLERFSKNPAVLFNHDSAVIVGTASDVTLDADGLSGLIKFGTAECGKAVEDCWLLTSQDVLRVVEAAGAPSDPPGGALQLLYLAICSVGGEIRTRLDADDILADASSAPCVCYVDVTSRAQLREHLANPPCSTNCQRTGWRNDAGTVRAYFEPCTNNETETRTDSMPTENRSERQLDEAAYALTVKFHALQGSSTRFDSNGNISAEHTRELDALRGEIATLRRKLAAKVQSRGRKLPDDEGDDDADVERTRGKATLTNGEATKHMSESQHKHTTMDSVETDAVSVARRRAVLQRNAAWRGPAHLDAKVTITITEDSSEDDIRHEQARLAGILTRRKPKPFVESPDPSARTLLGPDIDDETVRQVQSDLDYAKSPTRGVRTDTVDDTTVERAREAGNAARRNAWRTPTISSAGGVDPGPNPGVVVRGSGGDNGGGDDPVESARASMKARNAAAYVASPKGGGQ